MNPTDASRTLPPGADGDLDLYLEKFEAERGRAPGVDLRDFLPPAAHPDHLAVLRELVRVDLEFAWEEGAERRLEFYREYFPELFADPESVRAVAWEEFRLRQAAGEAPTAAEYRNRFGIELSDLIGPMGGNSLPRTDLFAADRHPADTDFRLAPPSGMPEPGDAVGGFVVLSELGRGAFGRVFLARQSDLADRLVALKVSSRLPGEPRTLARLQHTNIVPVYSVHRHGPYHVVCMPYLGPATLADLLDAFRKPGGRPRTGQDVAGTLADRAGPTLADSGSRRDAPTTPAAVEPAGPSRRALEALARLGYVDAVLWLGAQVADGLAHAHERGIVHRDVKPANVLLTDEGRPMLLDFNLATNAADPATAEGGVGGTLRYMAPEALAAVAERRANADPRSDVYGLGLLLYELLTGEFPFPDRTGRLSEVVPSLRAARLRPPPDPARLRPDVTPATAAILTKCLAPDPADRYPSAAELRKDLQRQLENRPLKYAPDRSVRERARKWAKRHPRLASGATVSAVATALLLLASAGGWWWYREANRLEGQRLAAVVGGELERVRPLAWHGRVTADTPVGQLREARDRCRAVLEPLGVTAGGDWKDGRYVRRLSGDDRDRLCAGVGQLLHLWATAAAGLRERSADPTERTALLAEALAASDRAKAAFGDHCPDVVLDRRNRLRQLAGLERDETPGCPWDRVPGIAPHTAEYVSAVATLESGDAAAAAERLGRFVRDGQPSASAWAALGAAQLRLGRWDEAARALTAAAALAPDSPWEHFDRGVAYLKAGRFADAEADFTRALELNPDVPEARLNRAIARVRQQDFAGAFRDLDELERAGGGDDFPRLYFVREAARGGLKDTAGADADRDAGLRREPRDPAGWVARGEARLRRTPPDPQGALADFKAATRLDPANPKAWENKAHVLSERLDKPADAVRALDRAIELHPDYVLARAGRAVLHARLGNRAAARADAAECLRRDRSALTCYQAACAYLLTAETPADRTKGLGLLREAVRKDTDGRWAKHMPADPDLKAVRESQEFKNLMTAAGVLDPSR